MTDAELERRLRRALGARARAVSAQDLRPVVSERRATPIRWWLPLSAGLAAVAVVMMIFVVFHRADSPERPDRPIAPAGSGPASTPVPAVSRTTLPIPSPAVTTPVPSVSGAVTAAPGGSRFPRTAEATG